MYPFLAISCSWLNRYPSEVHHLLAVIYIPTCTYRPCPTMIIPCISPEEMAFPAQGEIVLH